MNRQLVEMTEQWKTVDARLEELKAQEEQLTFSVDSRIVEVQNLEKVAKFKREDLLWMDRHLRMLIDIWREVRNMRRERS